MGKQSARMYYQGQDHCDLVYNGDGTDGKYLNHSRIYLNSKLVWQREKPRYLVYNGNRLYTTEKFKMVSEFNNTINVFGSIIGLTYFAEHYIIANQTNIYISVNGYDWKTVYTPETTIHYMGVIETDSENILVIVTALQIIYCKSVGSEDLRFEIKYTFPFSDYLNTIAKNSGRCILIQRGGGMSLTQYKIENEEITESSNIYIGGYEGKESKCFYRFGGFPDYHVERSFDGITWKYFCEQAQETLPDGTIERYGVDGIVESGGYIYMTLHNVQHSSLHIWVFRAKQSEIPTKHIIVSEDDDPEYKPYSFSLSLINNTWIISYRHSSTDDYYHLCKADDIFSVVSDGQGGFLNTEPIRATFQNVGFRAMQCASTDENLIFYYVM